ncbi:hyccin-like isoform X2 [Ostrea edulis]|uniref:hyccin-like isoform X2 n=1 Tax=Ostrea edulis TaxID=37623 RepID=UPI0024AFF4B8|nr:hyccin-like isoform X2 [Ostrea edulis]XP_056009929.1 hyccin-like isoform X2 [Ostrea edulis]XP_056009930.1 hyccin-like isoform X2 [Ostrea edulis]
MTLPRAVREWLSEFKSLPDSEIHTYASTVRQNEELTSNLYCLFDRLPHVEVLDPVCHQLFEFYRSRESGLKAFSKEFIPVIIWAYLSALSTSGKKTVRGLEAFLLGVYNLETTSSDGRLKVKTFRIPTFSQPSLYHEPLSISSISLTESALSRLDRREAEVWCSGPPPQYEAINGQNRQSILSNILQTYMAEIAELTSQSHHWFCKSCSRIATTGFLNLADLYTEEEASFSLSDSPQSVRRHSQYGDLPPRLAISPSLMIEMLSGLYYVTFNSQPALGLKAIYDLHHRASYELYADVILVTNAMINSLQTVLSSSSNSLRGMMAVTPSTSAHSISKSAITNASFRAKKLPDDINIVQDEDTAKLATIDEDSPEVISPKAASKSSKFNLAKAILKGDKSKLKEPKKEAPEHKTSLSNGDTTDSVHVAVVKNNSRIVVDNMEMQSYNRKNVDLDNSDDKTSSPLIPKPRSASSIGKDMKAKLQEHNRNPSGSSVNSDNYSTNL